MKGLIPCLCLTLFFPFADLPHAQGSSYAKDVRPFLDKYCVECHQGKKAKAGVNLASFESMMAASRKGRKIVVAGQADKSQLVTCVEGTNGRKMPPKKNAKQPTEMEIKLLRDWVNEGAKDGATDSAADEKSLTITFSKDSLNKLPVGWKADHTGKNGAGAWKVGADSSAPSKKGYVLAQTGESLGSVFNLCVADNTSYQDVEVTVAFKANKGKKDQGGGIIWRYTDASNYYVARFNPLEDNYRLYKVVDGSRKQLATKEEIVVPAGEWHTLTVKMTGDQIECSLDGKKHLEAKDNTFQKAGKVGLWTKADAQTSFDQLVITNLKK
jgi:hypothetical protein